MESAHQVAPFPNPVSTCILFKLRRPCKRSHADRQRCQEPAWVWKLFISLEEHAQGSCACICFASMPYSSCFSTFFLRGRRCRLAFKHLVLQFFVYKFCHCASVFFFLFQVGLMSDFRSLSISFCLVFIEYDSCFLSRTLWKTTK